MSLRMPFRPFTCPSGCLSDSASVVSANNESSLQKRSFYSALDAITNARIRTEGEREREGNRQTDRQTGRQTETGKQTDIQANRFSGKDIVNRQTSGHTEKQPF